MFNSGAVLGAVLLLATAYVLCPAWLYLLRRVRRLPASAPLADGPLVSVVIAARDEEANIGQTLADLRNQSYPHIELIVVDDRSRDRTADVAREHARVDDRMRVLRVKELPPGWLGKNHACWLGARHASGDWLLFTDADVRFDPEAIRDAVGYALGRPLDHLTLLPASPPVSLMEAAALGFFGVLFLATTWGSAAHWRRCPWAYAGVGAFNLVRRSAYEAVGGHERLRLEVVDDVMLGRLIKQAGFVQELLFGGHRVRVRWQVGARGIIGGLEKNAFAGVGYSVARAVWAAVGLLVLFVLGPAYAFVSLDPAALAAVAATALTTARLTLLAAGRWAPGFAYPLAAVLMAVALLRSTYLTMRRGAVCWRDTCYSLDELRRARAQLSSGGHRQTDTSVAGRVGELLGAGAADPDDEPC